MVTMRYVALLGGDESTGPAPGTPEFDGVVEQGIRFNETAADAIVGGEALQIPAGAVELRPIMEVGG
jgi:hypothetical protein